MKTEYHLVLVKSLTLFGQWAEEFVSVRGMVNFTCSKRQLKIIESDIESIYIPFTPRMVKDHLLGCRFKSIINEIGLTEKELAIFNLFVGG